MNYMTKKDASLERQKKTEVVEGELEKLIVEHKTISAELVVGVASDAAHPLHRYFEWDDSLAASKYRLAQATSMIMATKFVVILAQKGNDLPEAKGVRQQAVVRKLLPVGDRQFSTREEVLGSETARAHIVDKKRGELRSWCRSVVDIDELAPERTAIETVLG